MIDPKDMEHCRAAIREGSYSFHAASRLLPASVRDPALALYAFCRCADDEVDFGDDKPAAVLALSERLDAAYRGSPRNCPTDRAFTAMIEEFDMPRALPEALLEGLAWDGMERRYATLSDLRAYSARVASAVGAMMCVLMRVRDEHALARACDLGVAMQLTNIARDIGEDARAGRLYLPTDWLAEIGLEERQLMGNPVPCRDVQRLTKRLLAEAHRLYLRSEAGISRLPISARPGIFAARHCYDAIGRKLARSGYDSISMRATTSARHKIGLLGLSMLRAGWVTVTPESPVIFAKPLPETEFLVEAAAHPKPNAPVWGESVIAVLSQLKSQDHMTAAE